jgi:hypothetical protein
MAPWEPCGWSVCKSLNGFVHPFSLMRILLNNMLPKLTCVTELDTLWLLNTNNWVHETCDFWQWTWYASLSANTSILVIHSSPWPLETYIRFHPEQGCWHLGWKQSNNTFQWNVRNIESGGSLMSVYMYTGVHFIAVWNIKNIHRDSPGWLGILCNIIIPRKSMYPSITL